MPSTKPYQPLILRILHGITALLVISAAITGFLVYDSWDGRFGRLALTLKNREFIDIHGTFGFFFLPIMILFTIYSIRVGYRRLIQANSFSKLKEFGKPIWWYTLQRFANSLMLISALFALLSGKFQDENWLPEGQLNHPWYYAHLIAWCGVVVALALHLLMSVKVGGIPLLLSMFDAKIHPDDSPKLWSEKVKIWLRNPHL
ncbi:cytochrome b/b6 domain-containing protein [Floridanema evergladense]|uniref:Cytochrome b/b6 domain-containing protein n=1 Tax=Floridaenema evergladense BLCC-F167 TaxID=3153639 RepID=A0ABV4WS55_9CYAN